jgi:predicted dehydrogenase
LYVVEQTGTSGGDTHLWPEINGRIAGDLADELDHFVRASLSGEPYVQDYREALDAIPVLDALAASARTALPVEVVR